jgi:hypothetical protein
MRGGGAASLTAAPGLFAGKLDWENQTVMSEIFSSIPGDFLFANG